MKTTTATATTKLVKKLRLRYCNQVAVLPIHSFYFVYQKYTYLPRSERNLNLIANKINKIIPIMLTILCIKLHYLHIQLQYKQKYEKRKQKKKEIRNRTTELEFPI